MEETLQKSRTRVIRENTPEELFNFLTRAATPANFRRFQEHELEEIFYILTEKKKISFKILFN